MPLLSLARVATFSTEEAMYGIVIEGLLFMIRENFGSQIMTQVEQMANLVDKEISTHDQYSEQMVPNIFNALNEITGMSQEQLGVLAGRFFVQFLLRNGFGDLMNVMGRRFSDLLKGLDNIHEYFRFSYPRIRAPSFFCKAEYEDGLILHYRSRRRGYLSYVIGILVELARIFYNEDIGVQCLKKKEKGQFSFVVLKIIFKNTGLALDNRIKLRVKNLNEYLPVDTKAFLKMFPFYLAFNKNLDIFGAGQGLLNIIPTIHGQPLTDVFDLQRPCIKISADGFVAHQNCIFQFESLHPVLNRVRENILVQINDRTHDKVPLETNGNESKEGSVEYENLPYVTLRGPIIHLKESDTFLFLATCVVDELDSMFRMGLYLNDFGEADCNKEIIMASIQKSDTLKEMLCGEKRRSEILSTVTRETAEAKRKSMSILHQKLPISVARRVMKSEAMNCSEAFECVTIAFIRICDFEEMAMSMSPVAFISCLNKIYSLWERVMDNHGVFKIQTFEDSFMMSAGCPYKDENDAEIIIDCCLELIEKMKHAEFDDQEAGHFEVTIGVFSGPVVAGVVGYRNPRYCIFGETVNGAMFMEKENNIPMTIIIGPRAKDRLDKQAKGAFKVKARGTCVMEGRGQLKIFEVDSKKTLPRCKKVDPLKKTEATDDDMGFDDFIEDLAETRSIAMSRMSITESLDSSSSRRNSLSKSYTDLNKEISETIKSTEAASKALEITLEAAHRSFRPEDEWKQAEVDQFLKKRESLAKTDSQRSLNSRISNSDQSRAEVEVASVTESMTEQDEIDASLVEDFMPAEEDKSRRSSVISAAPSTLGELEKAQAEAAAIPVIAEPPHEDAIPRDVRHAIPKESDSDSDVDNEAEKSMQQLKLQQKNFERQSLTSASKRKKKEHVSETYSKEEDELQNSEKRHDSLKKKSPENSDNCRCEDIKKDGKLKTKVCSIQ